MDNLIFKNCSCIYEATRCVEDYQKNTKGKRLGAENGVVYVVDQGDENKYLVYRGGPDTICVTQMPWKVI